MKKNLILFFIVSAVLVSCAGCDSSDIAFGKKTFTYLVQGRYPVRRMIDWENFQCQGTDVGKQYKLSSDQQQRVDFERGFIDYFRQGFASQKGSLNNLKWAMFGKKNAISVVCARNPKQEHFILLVIIRHQRFQKKIVGLHAMQVFDEQKLEEFRREQLS